MSTVVYRQTMKPEHEQTDQWLQFPTTHMTQKPLKAGTKKQRSTYKNILTYDINEIIIMSLFIKIIMIVHVFIGSHFSTCLQSCYSWFRK